MRCEYSGCTGSDVRAVDLNDVAFSLHAVAITGLTILQVGDPQPQAGKGLLAYACSFAALAAFLCSSLLCTTALRACSRGLPVLLRIGSGSHCPS